MPAAAPDAASSLVFAVPRGQRYLSAFGFAVCAIVAVPMFALAIFCVVQGEYGVGAVVTLTGAVLAALGQYVWRDVGGKWGLRVTLSATALELRLPANRSLIHRPPALTATIPYGDIAAVETRLEGYRTWGMAMVQRAYALRRTSGEVLFLFEDRALGSGLESPFCGPIADAICARAQVPLRDLGMVEGKGGLLGAWGTAPADWHAPALDAAARERIWRRVRLTGVLLAAVFMLIFALSFI